MSKQENKSSKSKHEKKEGEKRSNVLGNDLWRWVVHSIHNLGRKPFEKWGKKSLPGAWMNVVNVGMELEGLGITFSSLFDIRIGDGSDTLFWYDDWTGLGSLASICPRLINLDKKKSAFVSERLCGNQPNWKWKRAAMDQMEAAEFIKLEDIMMGAHTSSGADTWTSKLLSDGSFYVRDLRHLIN